MSIQETQKEIVEEFQYLPDWEEKYGEIIRLGRKLPEYPEEFRDEKYKVKGCQSQVWLHPEFKDGKICFDADSDAMIVKGLIGLLMRVYNNRTPQEILDNPPDFLQEIGIDNHLSPTRKNGLGAMMKQIQMYAVAFRSMEK
ncbi:MAG TPA: SufE family protein [Ignavibacteria bacterium]|nr:SufE family protein [Ignavibacteria bacterium]